MPCFVLDQISVIQLAWSADINQIQDQNIGKLQSIFSSIYREREILCLFTGVRIWYPLVIWIHIFSQILISKSTSGCVFTLGDRAISWRSVKQSCIVDSTMEAKYVATCEAAKEVVWLKKFLSDLSVVRIQQVLITFFCGNSGMFA